MSADFEKTVLEEFKKIHDEFGTIHSEINDMHSEINDMHSEIKELQHAAEITKQSLVLIENKVSFELPALFDGYKMSRDMQEIQHSRLNSLSIKVEDHDNRISVLELNAK